MSNIWTAAADGNLEKVMEFISNGQTANSKDDNGYTPMHAAAAYGHTRLLLHLTVDAGGDVNIQDNSGDTPLHHAESTDIAKLLVEQLGADFRIENNEGLTAAMALEQEEQENSDDEDDNEKKELRKLLEFLQSLKDESVNSHKQANGH